MNERNPGPSRRLRTAWAVLCLWAVALPAHAYMDPGSMSVIVTAILGAIAAVGYTARLYWAKAKALVARLLGRGKQGGGEE